MAQVVEGRAKYAKQTGGRGQYGHVVLRVNVDGPELGITVVNALVGGVIPSRFVPAVEGGIRKAIDSGILAVRGYRDARIEVIDGAFHDIDSSNSRSTSPRHGHGGRGAAIADAFRRVGW